MDIGIVKSRRLDAYRLNDLFKVGGYDVYWHVGRKGLGVRFWRGYTGITVGAFTLAFERMR